RLLGCVVHCGDGALDDALGEACDDGDRDDGDGCDHDCQVEPPMDASVPDAAGADSAGADAGTSDAGMPDAGMPDASGPDASEPDSGVLDAAEPDAGQLDAGSSPIEDGGCGACTVGRSSRTGGASGTGGVLSLTLLLWWVRRHRRASGRLPARRC